MTELPDSQQELLDILRAIPPGQPMPSLAELASRLSLSSTSGVQSRLGGLALAGEITWQPGKARSIRVLRPGHQWVSVPEQQLPLVEAVLDPSPATVATVEQWVANWRKAQRLAAVAGYNPEEVPL